MGVFSTILILCGRELRLLTRDRSGLLTLFLMPSLLVVVLTLVQANILELTGQKSTEILLLDQDNGVLASRLQQYLGRDNSLSLVAWTQGDRGALRRAVQEGRYRAGLVIGPATTIGIRRQVRRMFAPDQEGKREQLQLQHVQLFFDPACLPGTRKMITARLASAFHALVLEEKLRFLGRRLARLGFVDLDDQAEEQWLAILTRPLLLLDAGEAIETGPSYNPVQQNVPAWALFGMFFTAIPIAGGILRERHSGLQTRLRMLPIWQPALLLGRIAAYLLICCGQFLLILLLGRLLFPLLGLPAFSLAGRPLVIVPTVLLSGLAACSLGVLLGQLCSSYEQASTLGATLVVGCAALGGVMVPVHVMPSLMRQISMLSPFSWSLASFHDLLVRQLPFMATLGGLVRLVLLSCVLFIVAQWLAWHRNRRLS